ncbi:MAG: lysophospholipid acyltransferase family protein [Akkermansiaceae bacterium]
MAPSRNTEIKGSLLSKILGYLAAGLMKAWSLTLRYHVNGEKGTIVPSIGTEPVIFTLWHNRIFTMPPIWNKTGGNDRSSVVLTSASKDGTTLATTMRLFGLGAIRGSSSRRAISALIGMRKALREGLDVCVTPDGPKGPRYTVQPGILKIAQSTNSKIVPIHLRYSSAWRLSSWDRFVLPKPFSKVFVIFDEPIQIPKETTEEEFELERHRLEQCLLNGVDDR